MRPGSRPGRRGEAGPGHSSQLYTVQLSWIAVRLTQTLQSRLTCDDDDDNDRRRPAGRRVVRYSSHRPEVMS